MMDEIDRVKVNNQETEVVTASTIEDLLPLPLQPLPKSYSLINNEIVRHLPELTAEEICRMKEGKPLKNPMFLYFRKMINAYYKVTALDPKQLLTITSYDISVLNAVCTIFKANTDTQQPYFTPTMIYRALRGNNDVHPKPGELQEIKDSIEKWREITIRIDFSDYADKAGREYKDGNIYGFILPLGYAKEMQDKKGNIEKDVYFYDEEPPIWKFERNTTGRIVTFTDELKKIKYRDSETGKLKDCRMTKERIALLDEIIVTVGSISIAKHYRESKVNLDSIFDKMRIEPKSRAERALRDWVIDTVLPYYKAIGYIKDFEVYTNGFGKIEGVILNPKSKLKTLSKGKK